MGWIRFDVYGNAGGLSRTLFDWLHKVWLIGL
jgi:hypothetical protein